jgi:hypothetical protein
MWEANPLTIIIVINFQNITEVLNTLVIGFIVLARFLESFMALSKRSFNGDTTELSAVDVL